MSFMAEIEDNRIVLQAGQEQAIANAIVTALSEATGANLDGVSVTLTFSRPNEVTETYNGQVEDA